MTTTVDQAIVSVKAHIGAVGKEGQMGGGNGYAFRKYDDLVDAAHVGIVNAGLCIAPRVRETNYELRSTAAGKPQQWCSITIDWIVRGPAGDCYVGPNGEMPSTVGEAMDVSDKATNKAHTAAMKLLLSQLFQIPYKGEDPDEHRPEMGDPDPWAMASLDEKQQAERVQQVLDNELSAEQYEAVRAAVSALAAVTVGDVRDLDPTWLKVWRGEIKKVRKSSEVQPTSEPDSDAGTPPSQSPVDELSGTGPDHESGPVQSKEVATKEQVRILRGMLQKQGHNSPAAQTAAVNDWLRAQGDDPVDKLADLEHSAAALMIDEFSPGEVRDVTGERE